MCAVSHVTKGDSTLDNAAMQTVPSVAGIPPKRRAPRRGAAVGLSTCAAVGLSTCAPFSGDQNQSGSWPRVVVRLIWSVQTLDNAAMTANVWSTRPAPAPSLAGNAGYASATCERFTAALVNPRQVRTRATDAAATTGHISTVDNLSRVLDHQIRRRRLSARPNDWFWLREYAAQVERPRGAPVSVRPSTSPAPARDPAGARPSHGRRP
jgi:hypothetical protein